jgi:hypothetical protein
MDSVAAQAERSIAKVEADHVHVSGQLTCRKRAAQLKLLPFTSRTRTMER